jgi:hypothetical protein
MSLTKISAIATLLCVMVSVAPVSGGTLTDFGTYTRDSATGLDWLDLTATQNRSFNDVSSGFGLAGEFAGWRYASVGEVRAFWINAGLVGGISEVCTGTPGCFSAIYPTDAVENLVGLLGETLSASYTFRGVVGLTSTPYAQPPDYVGCGGYPCHVTAWLRMDSVEARAMVVGGLRDYCQIPLTQAG